MEGLGLILVMYGLSLLASIVITVFSIVELVRYIKRKKNGIDLFKRGAVDLDFSKEDESYHEGCESVGHILHPEKSGYVKKTMTHLSINERRKRLCLYLLFYWL